jgi:dTDP-4-amino-4,6-dideoxygalactose transaminase
MRADIGAEAGYSAFKKNEERLCKQPIKRMSKLSNMLLNNINFKHVAKKRIENFETLQKKLSSSNKLNVQLNDDNVPLCYPFFIDNTSLAQKLKENRIYCAQYWANVLEWTLSKSFEYLLASRVLYLPIDQRYQKEDMERIAGLLLE